MMLWSRLVNLWERIQKTIDQIIQKYFGFSRSSVWLRFLLLPALAIVAFLLSRQLGSLIEWVTDIIMAEPGAPPQDPGVFLDWIRNVIFPAAELTPPQPTLFESLRDIATEIGMENLQLALLGGITFWMAHRLISMYVYHLYGMTDYTQAKHMVSSAFIPFRRRRAVIRNGKELPGQNISIHEMYGGQITLSMNATKGFAAVMERPDHSQRIVGPQDQYPVFLDGFLHLRQVVDLREQLVQVNVQAHSLDGFPIKIRGAIFRCRISGSVKTTHKPRFEACDTDAIHKLAYLNWIGPEWENPTKRRKALHDFVSTTLSAFISDYPLVEILPEMKDYSSICQSGETKFKLLDRFVQNIAVLTGDHGLEFEWTGQGEWQLPEGVNPDIIAQYCNQATENLKRGQPSRFSHEGIKIRHLASRQLVQHMLRLYEEAKKSNEPDDEMFLRLTKLYLERLHHAVRILESRGEKCPQEWIETKQHLERLTL